MKSFFRWGIFPLIFISFSFQLYSQTIWIPVKVNVFRKTNGTFDAGKEIDLLTINEGLAYANRKFLNAGVQFFICNNTWNTIDNTTLYQTAFFPPYSFLYNGNSLPTESKAINLYLTPNSIAQLNDSKPVGVAAFPEKDEQKNTHLFVQTGLAKPFFYYTLTHELGHIFFLYHTHNKKLLESIEAIDGSNCNSNGDRICDTPADYYPNLAGVIYDPTLKKLVYKGTKKDKYGNKYNPPLDNLMSYYYTVNDFHTSIFDHFRFTSKQLSIIRQYAIIRANWLNHNFNFNDNNSQTLPTNLQTSKSSASSPIILTWQENSTTETGYFIERSTTSSTSGFVCVGGVAPNSTSFPDSLLTRIAGIVYYRIRPSNSKEYYSAVASYNPSQRIETKQLNTNAPSFEKPNNPNQTNAIINVCKGSSFEVDFDFEGNFNSNNLFKVQLSDQNGVFGANPLVIGTNSDAPITATIPTNQSFPNGNYKIRIVSTNPVITSSPSSDSYNIYPPISPPTVIANPSSIPVGASTVLTASGCSGTVYWSNNKTGSSQSVSPTQNITYSAYCQASCKSDNSTVNVTVTYPLGLESINYAEYFFDSDPGFGNGTSLPITSASYIETTLPISTNSISQGLHILNIRVRTTSNKWSVTNSQPVYVYSLGVGNATQINKVEYFFDVDPGFGNGVNFSILPDSTIEANLDFNTGSLSQGLHLLNVRVQDGSGRWSVTQTQPIAVIGVYNNNKILTNAEYFIDTDPGIGNGTLINLPNNSEITSSFSVNLSSFDEGIHVFYVRVKDNTNQWSVAYSQPFAKISSTLTTQIARVEYYIDTDPGLGNGSPISYSPNAGQDVIGNISIPTTSISKGIHNIYVRAKDTANKWSNLFSKTFEIEIAPCPPVENITTQSTGKTQALERIYSNGTIISNATYQAGNSITLSPGFQTQTGSIFKVIISGCTND